MTYEVVVLFVDFGFNSCLKLFAFEVGEIVISQIFELKLIGRSLKSLGIGGGNDRVGELPNLTDGILERTVTVDHNLNAFAGSLEELFLNGIHNRLTIAGEELDLILGSLIRAQKTVICIEARAVYGSIQNLVQTENDLGARCLKNALCAYTGVNVAAEDVLCVGKDRLCVVRKNDLRFGAAFADEAFVICNVVYTGKGVLLVAKQLAVFFKGKHVAIGVDAFFVNDVKANKMISNLVRGVGEH